MSANFRRMLMVVSLLSTAVIAVFSMFLIPAAAQSECTNPPPRLVVGERGYVLPGDSNTVRDQPSRSGTQVGVIPAGEDFGVLEGPVCADGFNWWHVLNQNVDGWTVEGADGAYWLEPISPTPTPFVHPQELTLINDICPDTEDRLIFGRTSYQTTHFQQVEETSSFGEVISIGADGTNACLLVGLSAGAYREETITQLVWSPDGALYAYRMWNAGITSRLLIEGIEGRPENYRFMMPDVDNYQYPQWSPDGEVFTYLRGQQVWTADQSGRRASMLVDMGRDTTGLKWSPDGRWLAVADLSGITARITLIPAAGGDPQVIATAEINPITIMTWLPDSSALLVSSPGHGIYFINVEEALTTPVQIVWNREDHRSAQSISPDGERMAYFVELGSPSEDGRVTLQVSGLDGESTITLAEEINQPLRGRYDSAYPPSWSPDGTMLTYADASGAWVIDVMTSERTLLWEGAISGAPVFEPAS